MNKDYDYIIVGTGASGLMMAYRMALDPFFDDKTILLLDKEKKLSNDRTWCFWEAPEGEWDAILTASWQKVLFKTTHFSTVENIAPYQYKMIKSKNFYEKIWHTLNTKTNIVFSKQPVISIKQETEKAHVITATHTFSANTVINSVLFDNQYKEQQKYPVLQQHFVGFFIKTKENIFDDAVATFMDFTVPQKSNTRFMYVLPYAKNEALFEYTLFSSELLPYQEYVAEIEAYLLEKGITAYEIVEKEQGVIPMTSYKFWKKNSKNIINIGTAGGWSKASTGFTFKNINKNSKALLVHLKEKKSLESFYKRSKFWWYDLLLLDILSEKNHLGAKIFSKMFQKTPAHKILKFLDDETSLKEDLEIILKIPPYHFVRALIKRMLAR